MANELALKGKVKYNNKYSAHGISLPEYIATPGISLWMKLLFYIMIFYEKHPGKLFFRKYSTIVNDFATYGWECKWTGIRNALWILRKENLVKVEYNSMTKEEWIEAGKNPKKYIYRTVHINYARVNKFLSCYIASYKTMKDLPSKSRLKRFFNQRFMSYTRNLVTEYKRQMKAATIETYKSPMDMLKGCVYGMNKYYDPSKFILNYIPEHTIDLNKEDILQANKESAEAMEKAKRAKRIRAAQQANEQAQKDMKAIYDVYGNNPPVQNGSSKEAPKCFKEFLERL